MQLSPNAIGISLIAILAAGMMVFSAPSQATLDADELLAPDATVASGEAAPNVYAPNDPRAWAIAMRLHRSPTVLNTSHDEDR